MSELPPYQPGCAWNDWVHAIAEALKKDPDAISKLVTQFTPPKIETPTTNKP